MLGRQLGERGSALSISDLRKSYGSVQVLRGVTIHVSPGEFVSLVGPSGCGKTTTLNTVAGFETPDSGDVTLDGRSLLATPSHRRGLGMVFQSHALFPHMTVTENVGFGLLMRGAPRADIAARVGEALDLVRLRGFGDRYPKALSGGQQQRVGIARALTVDPSVVLMDEPLSSLDAQLRREMQVELRAIQKRVGITAIYVTHDQEEALTLSDRIVLMRQGEILQAGPPEEIYSRPNDPFVMAFLGEASFLDALVVGSAEGACVLRLGGAEMTIPMAAAPAAGARIRLGVRPDRVCLAPPAGGIRGTVASRAFVGPVLRYVVKLDDGSDVKVQTDADEPYRPAIGEPVSAVVNGTDWIVFPVGS